MVIRVRVLVPLAIAVAVAPLVPAIASPATGRYIVALRRDAGPEETAREHSDRYGVNADRFYRHAFKGYAATIREDRVAQLRNDPSVLMVSRNRTYRAAAETLPTGVDRIDADTSPGNGESVQVAVLDTGIDLQHPDLAGNILGGIYCPRDGEPSSGSFDDPSGHGSHVAGTIAAIDNTDGVVGAAPQAKLWAVRVLDASGVGDDLSLLCGLEFVYDRAPANNGLIRVANMSIEAPIPDADDGNCGLNIGFILHFAICTVTDVGVTFVVAAGNHDVDIQDVAPAAFDEVITVTALADYDGKPCSEDATHADDDTFASFSNRATLAGDLAHTIGAPGVEIFSTIPGGYALSDGTSMASPHVAAAAARYLHTHPGVSNEAVLAALLDAAEPEDVNFNTECVDPAVSHTDPSNEHPEPVLRVPDWEIPIQASTPGVVRGNVWFLNNGFDPTGNVATFSYGNSTDRIVVGDWDGDGVDSPGVVRGNVWYLNNDLDGSGDVPSFAYGNPTDRIVVGDWNDDGVDSPGVVRGNVWYLNDEFDGSANRPSFAYGNPTDRIVVGDWDGDGDDTPGVVRGITWYLNNEFDGSGDVPSIAFGNTTDQAMAGDWDGDDDDDIAVRRGSKWFLRLPTAPVTVYSFPYGRSTDRAVAGDWNGPTPP